MKILKPIYTGISLRWVFSQSDRVCGDKVMLSVHHSGSRETRTSRHAAGSTASKGRVSQLHINFKTTMTAKLLFLTNSYWLSRPTFDTTHQKSCLQPAAPSAERLPSMQHAAFSAAACLPLGHYLTLPVRLACNLQPLAASAKQRPAFAASADACSCCSCVQYAFCVSRAACAFACCAAACCCPPRSGGLQ